MGTDRNYFGFGDQTVDSAPFTTDPRYGQLDGRRLRDQWLEGSQRSGTWRELAPGVFGDGNQRVRTENGRVFIDNYGTICIAQCGRDARIANGGYDWRNGDESQVYDYRPYFG